MSLQDLEVEGATITIAGTPWDLAAFELAFTKRDRQAKELTLAFRRAATPSDPAAELDLTLAGVRCARVFERDVPGVAVVRRFAFARDVESESDPCAADGTIGAAAAALLRGAGVADAAPGACVHIATANDAVDILCCCGSVRADARRTSASAPSSCDHGLCLRVSSKGGQSATVLPSGAVSAGLLEGCGDPEGLGIRLCLRCGHGGVLDDAAPFDLRALNAAVRAAEAAAVARKRCARCGDRANGDVVCGTCGSVCDGCGRSACREGDGHAVDMSKADFRCAAARSPRRRASANKEAADRLALSGETARFAPGTTSPPVRPRALLHRSKSGLDKPDPAPASPQQLTACCLTCQAGAVGDVKCVTCGGCTVCDKCAQTCHDADHKVENWHLAGFRLAQTVSPGRRRSDRRSERTLQRMKSTSGVLETTAHSPRNSPLSAARAVGGV